MEVLAPGPRPVIRVIIASFLTSKSVSESSESISFRIHIAHRARHMSKVVSEGFAGPLDEGPDVSDKRYDMIRLDNTVEKSGWLDCR